MDFKRSMESTIYTGLVIAFLDAIGVPLNWGQGLGMAAIAIVILAIIVASEAGGSK